MQYTQALADAPRLLLEATLKPVQGHRFQPTGFPDLGAAEYQAPDGTRMLLVESAQSVANRLEEVCWDDTEDDWINPLRGLSYVRVLDKDKNFLTASTLEAHRINSAYIVKSDDTTFFDRLKEELTIKEVGRINQQTLAATLLRYDIASLLHGVFLANAKLAKGQLRLPRALSGFIEASDINSVTSGGVKRDDVDPKGGGEDSEAQGAKEGFGHIPFHRKEYTGNITAYFNLDLAQIRGYRLPPEVQELLIALALFKVQKFLESGLRLRTACDLEVAADELSVKRPKGFSLPSLAQLIESIPSLIQKTASHFAPPEERTTIFTLPKKKKKSSKDTDGDEA